jgi:hypothetical protein
MTPALIKEMFTEFAGKSDAYIQIYIDQAVLSVNAAIWTGKTEVGIAYLTGHLMALMIPGSTGPSGPVTSEKVGDLSRNYASVTIANSNEYHQTIYGTEFLRLRRSLPISPMVL